MKKLYVTICVALVTLAVWAQTTRRISQYPNRTTPTAQDMFLLASILDNTNYFSYFSQVQAATLLSPNGLLAVSNALILNLGGSNIVFTNVTVTSGITNTSLTADTVVKADVNKRLASIGNGSGVLTNDGAGAFGWTTNLIVANAWFSNVVATNVIAASAWFSNVVATNLVSENAWFSNVWATNVWAETINSVSNNFGRIILTNGTAIKEWAWAGPTNTVYVGSTNRLYYTATTGCAITALVPWITPNYENHTILEITNAAAGNITITVHEPIRYPVEDASRVYTLTNGNVMVCSLEVATMGSNSVLRAFKP